MTPTRNAQSRAGDMSADGTEPGVPRCQNGIHRTGRCPTCGELLTTDKPPIYGDGTGFGVTWGRWPNGLDVGGEDEHGAPKTLRVRFSDACTDVLMWLADQPRGTAFTIAGIEAGTAAPDADDTRQTISTSLRTLYDCGLVEAVSVESVGAWRATDAGRKAVADAT